MRGAERCGARLCSPAPQLSPPLPSPLPASPPRGSPPCASVPRPPLPRACWSAGLGAAAAAQGSRELARGGNRAEPGPPAPGKGEGAGRRPRRAPTPRVGRGASRDAPLGSPSLATHVLKAVANRLWGRMAARKRERPRGRRPPTLHQADRAPGGDQVWRVARVRCLGM